MKWQAVIGLEIHAELNTESKMYCSCKNEFGGVPNSRCCPVCTGMPGTLPRLNRRAVECAVLAGLAMNAKISERTLQCRKNYFYPDLPKGYQISQFHRPLCTDGVFEYFFRGKIERARIRQLHIEEDAGKLIHFTDGNTQIDYNRCGVPLIEIVTHPDFHSPEQARAFLEAVRVMLLYLGISDCRMQEGSLRCDVNVSLRREGEKVLAPRVEMKNVNTFSGAERAMEYEIRRQISVLEGGGEIHSETRRWDDERRESFLLRTKENAADYRYFPEPDLPPILVPRDMVKRLSAELPELEVQKRARYIGDFNLPQESAAQLSADPELARFFDKAVALGADAKSAANLLLGRVAECINESHTAISQSEITESAFADIIRLTQAGEISASAAKTAAAHIFTHGGDAKAVVEKLGLRQISDRAELERIAAMALGQNPQAVADYAAGKKNAFGFLTGQCMRLSRGSANPQLIAELLKEILEGSMDEQ